MKTLVPTGMNVAVMKSEPIVTLEKKGATTMKQTTLSDNPIPRRDFCNQALFASMVLFATAKNHATNGAQQGATASYPLVRIEGAEGVMPGSFLYFSYPTPKDPAVLVRSQDGQYFALSRKCGHRGCSVDFDVA